MEKFAWIQDPFMNKAASEFNSAEKENLNELFSDKNLTTKFGSMEISEFWISVKEEYLPPSAKTHRILISFAASYLCEARVSAVAVVKSKYHAKINME
jgi:hypothetical protein